MTKVLFFKRKKFHQIPGHPDYYAHKRTGEILSNANLFRRSQPHILKPFIRKEYLSVSLNGRCFYLHRILALTFIANPDIKPVINHKNGVKTDNRIQNLEWCSSSENQLHAFRTGLKVNPSKLSANDVKSIIALKAKGFTAKYLATAYQVKLKTIEQIVSGKRWKHIDRKAILQSKYYITRKP